MLSLFCGFLKQFVVNSNEPKGQSRPGTDPPTSVTQSAFIQSKHLGVGSFLSIEGVLLSLSPKP